MGMGMRMNFENPMNMNMSTEMTFKNEYGCEYSYTRPEFAQRPSLLVSCEPYVLYLN